MAETARDAGRGVEGTHVAAARLVLAGDALKAEGVDVFTHEWAALQGSEEEADVKTLVAVLLPPGSSTDWTSREWGAVAVARRAGEKVAIAVARGAGKEAATADVRRAGEEFAAVTTWRMAADRAGLPVRDISSLRAATRRELRDMRWEGAVDVNDAMVARYYATLTQEEAGTNERAVAFAIAGRIANHGQPVLGLPGGAARLKTLFRRGRTGEDASGSRSDPAPELMANPDTSLDHVLPFVYHGTTQVRAESILKNGFQDQWFTSNGRRFGDGFYFSEQEKKARIWSRGANLDKGIGPVIKASIQGRVAFVDEPKLREAVNSGNLNSFPHVANETERVYLQSLLHREYPKGTGLPGAAVAIFLKRKGYSAMYLHPWKEILVFDASAITDITIIPGVDGLLLSAEEAGLPPRDIRTLRAETHRVLRDLGLNDDFDDVTIARHYATLDPAEANRNGRSVALAIVRSITGQPLRLPGGVPTATVAQPYQTLLEGAETARGMGTDDGVQLGGTQGVHHETSASDEEASADVLQSYRKAVQQHGWATAAYKDLRRRMERGMEGGQSLNQESFEGAVKNAEEALKKAEHGVGVAREAVGRLGIDLDSLNPTDADLKARPRLIGGSPSGLGTGPFSPPGGHASIALAGTYVRQGNGNGAVIDKAGSVLYTSDLAPCVAVCGHNGSMSFMIHSDSTTFRGMGAVDLISGIRRLVPVGTGVGWTISLIGGSTVGTGTYLRHPSRLPHATFYDLGEADGAYITRTGAVAASKRGLAHAMGVPSVIIS
ncbi:hypothetical protein [Actinacidiphila glaucinigra]|uniref:hypothetical protein n=1 Tax=Actinacidiphila glaucinigra TaxID=235986 RepID=UPI0035E22ACE